MRTFTSSLTKVCLAASLTSSAWAGDILLQKVPAAGDRPTARAAQTTTTVGLLNYERTSPRKQGHALYVSSGSDLAQANNMVDDQTSTSFGFSAADSAPTTVIDLGKICTVRKLSATYSPRAGGVDFYLLQTLPGIAPGEAIPQTWKLDDAVMSNLKPIGSRIDDGQQGKASVEFPAKTGRYVLVRWVPAAHADTAFTVAEVSAYGRDNLVASSGNFAANRTTADGKSLGDSKDMADSKDMGDNKDVPAEGPPEAPAEGPPPTLPQPPPFTFIPQLVPLSE